MFITSMIKRRSLTTKITITATMLTVMVILVLSCFFGIQQRSRIYREFEKRGLSLAKTTASNIDHEVQRNRGTSIQDLIQGIGSEEDIAYVLIQGGNGEVLARTDNGIETEALNGKVNEQALQVTASSIFTWKTRNHDRIYDISVITGDVGVTRIGMSLKSAEDLIHKSIIITVLLTIGLVALSILITWKIMRIILNPLQELLVCVQTTGEGDLNAKITVHDANDEIGQLSSAFTQMQKNLRDMVRQIRSISEMVDTSVTELSTSSNEQAAGANEQSTALTETSSTIEELATVSSQIAENAKKVAELADMSFSGMETIRDSTNEGANRIITLGEKSQSIGEVVGMIDDITRQTNLLALNASIEAARAGDAGKGFAVVATEIRKLATNVASSTELIREIIKEIQDATNASVLATENVSKSVDNGIEISKAAADSAVQIHMATQQQKSASDQMVATIKEMVTIAQQTAAGSNQIAETADRLSQATKEQKMLVEQFKIG